MPDYWFFLSYYRGDVNAYIRRFFQDLGREVRRLAALPADVKENDVGFLDDLGIEHGDQWPDRLAEALQTSQVLVCLYSRGYFASEYCGREFHVFRARVDQSLAETPGPGGRPQVILPVLWDREERVSKALPAAVAEIQYKHGRFGSVYAQEGLLNLMKKGRRYQAEYAEFLDRFAEKLVDAARTGRLPRLRAIPALQEVPSAFRPSAQQPATAPRPPNTGTDVAQFVFVAGRDTDFGRIRTNVTCYGSQGGRDWRPYLPEVTKAVGMISQQVAYDADLHYEVLPLGDDLVRQIRHAERTNTIVLLVVDPWSIQVEWYRRCMENCDQENLNVNCGVFVVWNQQDQETGARRGELDAAVKRLFFRTEMSNTFFRSSITSVEELQRELISAICEVRNRINRKATLFLQVAATPLPKISGPGGVAP